MRWTVDNAERAGFSLGAVQTREDGVLSAFLWHRPLRPLLGIAATKAAELC